MSTQNKPIVMSPLADPVVSAIFVNAQSAGLAAASLIGAILSKDDVTIGKVVSVTPQRYYKRPNERGCRVDIEITTDNKERIIVEVQIYNDPTVFQRNLLAASRIFTSESTEGTTSAQMAAAMPRVIAINILDFYIRDDSLELLQPVKLMYTKPPQRVALMQFSIYNVQLPCLENAPADFQDDFYCWLYVMNTAKQKNLTIEEVVAMTPELTLFAERNAGFQQYCEQYNRAASSPEIQEEYYRWINEQMRQQGMIQGAVDKAVRETKREDELILQESKREAELILQESKREAELTLQESKREDELILQKTKREAELKLQGIARNLLAINMPVPDIAKMTGLAEEKIAQMRQPD